MKILLPLLLALTACTSSTRNEPLFSSAPTLPVEAGLAGAILGQSGNAIIMAGGANFPDGMPWNGGRKEFHQAIFRLNINGEWQKLAQRLPFPLAQGMSIETDHGVLAIGGNDGTKLRREVFEIVANGQNLTFNDFPALPMALENAAVCRYRDSIFVCGGSTPSGLTNSVLLLELNNKEKGWQKLPPFPGKGRSLPIAAILDDGHAPALFLFSGFNAEERPHSHFSDVWKMPLDSQVWQKVTNIQYDGNARCIRGASSYKLDDGRLLLIGGSEGVIRATRDLLKELANSEKNPSNATQLKQLRHKLTVLHPGHSRDIILFDPRESSFKKIAELPLASSLKTRALKWQNNLLYFGGEIRPAVRTPEILKISLKQLENNL